MSAKPQSTYDAHKYRQWYEQNGDKKRAYAKARYAENPQVYIDRAKARRDASPGCWRKSHWKRRYGVTPEQVSAMRAAQDGHCAICGVEFDDSKKKLKPHIDHDHGTGKVRGLLCSICNTALGHVERDGFLEAALKYLGDR